MNNIYFPNHYRIIRNKEVVKRANNRETVYPKFRKSTRHRRERSKRRKNSTSQGRKAGVLEWVCNFEYVTKSKAYGTKKGHNDRYYQNLNSVYCR